MSHRHGPGSSAYGASRPGLSARQPLFGGAGGAAASDQVQVNIEAGGTLDLDDEIDQLRQGVGRLKQVSEAIGEESKLTASVMDSLEGAMDQARLSLRKTMRRLNRAYEDGKRGNHVLHLVLFAICLFLGLYFWHKLWRILRWFLSWVF